MRRGPGRQLFAAMVGGSALACASAGRPALLGPPREQPAALVGRWAAAPDSAHDARGRRDATAPRGSWLVLLADGAQWTEHAIDSAGATIPRRDSPHAWWWVYRGANGVDDRLCLHWRAGRHRADCSPYQLDTIPDSGRAVRRLRWGGAAWVAAP